MSKFVLKDSNEYYLALSEQPKQFDADSPATNVFFDDTNGEVFTVRSGGVTGVTVSGMDRALTASFRMEDKGPITSIKFSPDHRVLAIQRNGDSQNATVEFANFKDLTPTNVEYSHICKWKNSKILGFVWPKVNEIAFITDHGIELLQVLPEKKQLKSLRNTSFSGAWFVWCAQSRIVLLASNNGVLMQPFSLNASSITKLQKLELEVARPVVERDAFLLRLCQTTWCAIFKHGTSPTEVWLMSISGVAKSQYTHVLKTGLVGRFAISIVDDLIAVHHQASQTSQLFDIKEESKPENNTVIHIPIVAGNSMRPAKVGGQPCPMYSATWVVFQPDYVIDARLGYLWKVSLLLPGLAHSVPKEEIPKLVAVLLRRSDGKQTIYRILNQLVSDASNYLVELTKAFDEINSVYRKWADLEMARNTAGQIVDSTTAPSFPVLISQSDICSHVLQPRDDDKFMVQVVTALVSSVCRHGLVVQACLSAWCVRALVSRGAGSRLHALVRRGCLADARPLACQLLSLGHMDAAAAQLALDMMARLGAYEQIVEVLLSWNDPVSAIGAAKQANPNTWNSLSARKLLEAARLKAENGRPGDFVTVYHALQARNEMLRGNHQFLKGEQCDIYVEYYKQITSDASQTNLAQTTEQVL